MLWLERLFGRGPLRCCRLLSFELIVSLDDFVLATSARNGFQLRMGDVSAPASAPPLPAMGVLVLNGDDFFGDFSLNPGRLTEDGGRLVLMMIFGDWSTSVLPLSGVTSRCKS